MREIETDKNTSVYCGELARGCKLCWPGAKMVIFITGKCDKRCWYCPISVERGGKDQIYANERPVNTDSDIITEAKEMSARGASLTGGEPLLELDKCVHYIKLLKKEFGPAFHIHLYTWGDLATEENVKKLADAGLDEIRFHLFGDNKDRILPALEWRAQGRRSAGAQKLFVGVEIPAVPEMRDEIFEIVDYCAENKVDFLNLNELEFSDTNWDLLSKRGYEQVNDLSYRVKGSEEFAREIIDYCSKKNSLPVHYCSVLFKNAHQLPNRIKRRAKNLKKPFERITKNGLLLKGTVEGGTEDQYSKIAKQYGPRVFYSKEKNRIETTPALAKKIAKDNKIKAYITEEYPIWKPWDFEKTPIEK
ncbi:MAG: radical SAM protein [archaeon]